MPHLGLPVKWGKTAEKQQRIIFNTKTNAQIDIDTGTKKETKRSPVGFIKSTEGAHSMPGTDTPDAVRVELFHGLHRHAVEDAGENKLVPCLAHGDYVKVESLQADHAQAKSDIMKRQMNLVEKMNADRALAKLVMDLDGIEKFFVLHEEKYYGTLFFYNLYFNDIDNLWLICQACNLGKSDESTLDWFQNQWLYGEEFINYIGKLKDESILIKTKNREGLAEVAIRWFWERHAHYVLTSRKLLEEVDKPIQLLNRKLDRVIGSGKEARIERLTASLDFRLTLLRSVAKMSGISMPPGHDESPNDSSDEDAHILPSAFEHLSSPPKLVDYYKGTAKVVENAPGAMVQILTEAMIVARTNRKAAEKAEKTAPKADSSAPKTPAKRR